MWRDNNVVQAPIVRENTSQAEKADENKPEKTPAVVQSDEDTSAAVEDAIVGAGTITEMTFWSLIAGLTLFTCLATTGHRYAHKLSEVKSSTWK